MAYPRVRLAPPPPDHRRPRSGAGAGRYPPDDHDETAQKIAACDHKLAQYRGVLDAGASPVTVAGWIAETEAERARHEMSLRQSATRSHLSDNEMPPPAQAFLAAEGIPSPGCSHA